MSESVTHKTFGLKTPRDLHNKLRYDIGRLRVATASDDVKYAAFDCAIDAAHMVDWVLAAVNDERHLILSGEKRLSLQAPSGFADRQADKLPALKFCREIANGAKHFTLKPRKKPINVTTSSTVSIRMTIDKGTVVDARPYAYVVIDGVKYNVLEMFEDMYEQWLDFLKAENLLDQNAANVVVRKRSPEELMHDDDRAAAISTS
ncbi:hypothetical protein AB6806_09005 [Bosea sp. RCC_152_1]